MKNLNKFAIIGVAVVVIVVLYFALQGKQNKNPEAVAPAPTPEPSLTYERVVVLSGDVGDVVVALGAADKVVGRDDINRNPALKHASTIGVHRNLTVEPIIALKPDLAVGSYMVMPAGIYTKLDELKIKAVNVMPDEEVSSYAQGIRTLGDLLGKQEQATQLAQQWESGMSPREPNKLRYILSYDGDVVAGRDTVGDELIRRAGGINAAENISGLKPLAKDGWLAAKPDVIIISEHHQEMLGGLEKYKKRPEIAASAAAKNNKIYFWSANDFLRYGLDSPQVVDKLNKLAE